MRNMTKDVVLLLVSDKASPSITTNTSGEQKMFSCFLTAIFEPGMSFFKVGLSQPLFLYFQDKYSGFFCTLFVDIRTEKKLSSMELVHWSVHSSKRRGRDRVKQLDGENCYFKPLKFHF